MTEKTQPTDAEILDAADDFRSQYKHGGTTFDEFDALDFARPVHAKLITVPTIDGRDSCWGLFVTEQFICARFPDCPSVCTSGANRIWIDESQLHDYIAIKLVS